MGAFAYTEIITTDASASETVKSLGLQQVCLREVFDTPVSLRDAEDLAQRHSDGLPTEYCIAIALKSESEPREVTLDVVVPTGADKYEVLEKTLKLERGEAIQKIQGLSMKRTMRLLMAYVASLSILIRRCYSDSPPPTNAWISKNLKKCLAATKSI